MPTLPAEIGDNEFWLLAKQCAALGGTVTASDTVHSLQAQLVGLQGSGGGGGGGIPDAPSDGNLYGRENAAWTKAVAASGDTVMPVGTTAYLVLAAGNHNDDIELTPSELTIRGSAGWMDLRTNYGKTEILFSPPGILNSLYTDGTSGDLMIAQSAGPSSGKSVNLTNGFTGAPATLPKPSASGAGIGSFAWNQQRYVSAITPGEVGFLLPTPSPFEPTTPYQCYIKSCWFFLTGYGPMPAGCDFTLYFQQSTNTPVAITAAVDCSGITSGSIIVVPLLSGAQNVLYTVTPAQGIEIQGGVLMSATPSNAAANPALGWGFELGVIN
jgi:hypothetical protein